MTENKTTPEGKGKKAKIEDNDLDPDNADETGSEEGSGQNAADDKLPEVLDPDDPGNKGGNKPVGKNYLTEEEKKKIDQAVEEINGIAENQLFQAAIEIGDYIFQEFFDGDPKEVSSKNPNKNLSFNELCNHQDLKIHPNRLLIMVKVAIQEKFLENQKITGIENLTYTHKSILIRLPDDKKKTTLIKKCIKNNWSTRDLEREIQNKLKHTSSDVGKYIAKTTKFAAIANDIINIEKETPKIDESDVEKLTKAKRDNFKKSLKNIKKTFKSELTQEKIDTITKTCDEMIKIIEGYKPKKPGRPSGKK
jgi:hypothetical protein